MIHHYITKYTDEKNKTYIVSWLQLDIFGRCYCFSERRYELKPPVND